MKLHCVQEPAKINSKSFENFTSHWFCQNFFLSGKMWYHYSRWLVCVCVSGDKISLVKVHSTVLSILLDGVGARPP